MINPPVRCRLLAVLFVGGSFLLFAESSIAQTPEPALVVKETEVWDHDGNVVGKAAKGDVLEVLIGGNKGLITAGGPREAVSISSEHLVHPRGAAGKALLDELIVAGSTNPEHYHLRADNRMFSKDYEGMVADLTRAIELAPQDTRGYLSRAQAWMRVKKYDAALADLQEVSCIDPEQRPKTFNGLLRAYAAQEDWQRVVEVYTEKLEEGKRYGDGFRSHNLAGRAAAYEALEQYEMAKADYTSALESNPRNREAAAGLKRIDEKK